MSDPTPATCPDPMPHPAHDDGVRFVDVDGRLVQVDPLWCLGRDEAIPS